jgi:predicted nucleic acid-binding protein
VSTYLLDTNIVVRMMEPAAPEHAIVVNAMVATRPVEVNGFGWSPGATVAVIARLRSQFPLLEEGPATFERWLALVEAAEIRGKRAHDARLAAIILSHGMSQILTLNPSDFHGLQGVVAVVPSTVVGG